jgi:hypothetical protein
MLHYPAERRFKPMGIGSKEVVIRTPSFGEIHVPEEKIIQ